MIHGVSRRGVLAGTGALSAGGLSLAGCAAPRAGAVGAGPFEASWESLIAGYRTPDWFRDAKLGIWSHWGPQCVPEFGDWYGRRMYIQGDPFHDHHVATYGHPSEFGFIEFIGRWRAEAWDPEDLLDLYEAAGAKYIVSMANHHDNLDMFDSAHHPWNTVRVGPRRDIVGAWERLVRARGLRFGVSNHAAHAWHWFQAAYSYDPEGPMAGVRYDAHGLTRADGAGTWWEGMDPQALYTGPSMVAPDGIATIAEMDAWRAANDGEWIETIPAQNPAFARNWALRQRDLVDRYRPDFVYFDNYELPLEHLGLEATVYYYNASLGWRGELPVVTGKRLSADQRKGITESVERGFLADVRDEPWQTCTCIGDWHYNRARYRDRSYVPAKAVIQRLVDVVSKNGTLLLSIPQRGDGSIDSEERAILHDMATWMAVNAEAIHSTRPWRVSGEGPTRIAEGMFGESEVGPFGAEDVRFTVRGDVLYAIPMDWPGAGRALSIRSLGRAALQGRRVEAVELVGGGPVAFDQGEDVLSVILPENRPVAWAPALRVRGVV